MDDKPKLPAGWEEYGTTKPTIWGGEKLLYWQDGNNQIDTARFAKSMANALGLKHLRLVPKETENA